MLAETPMKTVVFLVDNSRFINYSYKELAKMFVARMTLSHAL